MATKTVFCEQCDSTDATWNKESGQFLCGVCAVSNDGAERVVEYVEVSDDNLDRVANRVLESVNAADLMGIVKRLRESKTDLDVIKDVDFVEIANKAKDGVRLAGEARQRFEDARERIEKAIEEAEIPKRVEFKKGKEVRKVEGFAHKNVPLLADLIANRIDCYLGGPAGSGKNTAVEQVAKAADVPFHTLQLSKLSLPSALTGYIRPMDGEKVETSFSLAYANGGVFAADELDNWNSNVLTSINSALANGFYTFPWGRVDRHADFVFVGMGNTIGMGATANYTERSTLSGATRDRLVFLNWGVDETLEKKLTDEEEWLDLVVKARAANEAHGGMLLISPRATIQGSKLIKLGWKRRQVVESCLLRLSDAPTFLSDLLDKYIGGK